MRLSAVAAAFLAALPVCLCAQLTPPAAETAYAITPPAAETTYSLTQPAGETGYRAPSSEGLVVPENGFALVSTRRSSDAFRRLALGLQRASQSATAQRMGISSTREKSLEGQANELAQYQAGLRFLVDAPDPLAALTFASVARQIARPVVILARSDSSLPQGLPIIVLDPKVEGEVAARAAIELNPGASRHQITVIHSAGTPPPDLINGISSALLAQQNPNARVVAVDGSALLEATMRQLKAAEGSTALILISPEVAQPTLVALQRLSLNIPIVAVGESDAFDRAFAGGRIAVRVLPDYDAVFRGAGDLFSRTTVPTSPLRPTPKVLRKGGS